MKKLISINIHWITAFLFGITLFSPALLQAGNAWMSEGEIALAICTVEEEMAAAAHTEYTQSELLNQALTAVSADMKHSRRITAESPAKSEVLSEGEVSLLLNEVEEKMTADHKRTAEEYGFLNVALQSAAKYYTSQNSGSFESRPLYEAEMNLMLYDIEEEMVRHYRDELTEEQFLTDALTSIRAFAPLTTREIDLNGDVYHFTVPSNKEIQLFINGVPLAMDQFDSRIVTITIQ